MDEHLNGEVNGSASSSPVRSVHMSNAAPISQANQSSNQEPRSNSPPFITNSQLSSICSSSPKSTTTATSLQRQASTSSPPPLPPPPTTMNSTTQPSRPTTPIAGPASAATPPGTIPILSTPSQQAASSVHSRSAQTVPPASQNHPAAANIPQLPAQPPTVPWGYPSFPHPNVGLRAPPNMAAPGGWHQPFCYPPPHMQQSQQPQQYWYYYPGAIPSAGLPMTCTRPSPWWSGTSHYLTNPPPQAPQVYTVEPAYIMPQTAYYQPTMPASAAAPAYYYVAGAPAYYYC
ncbi:hypothetical protein F5Y12DRAFT_713974 [Xylaria sp. FL1777]|nr:hypothetical protein F5Y12DRAFT_713974 [Xylaria sp. FL1777]